MTGGQVHFKMRAQMLGLRTRALDVARDASNLQKLTPTQQEELGNALRPVRQYLVHLVGVARTLRARSREDDEFFAVQDERVLAARVIEVALAFELPHIDNLRGTIDTAPPPPLRLRRHPGVSGRRHATAGGPCRRRPNADDGRRGGGRIARGPGARDGAAAAVQRVASVARRHRAGARLAPCARVAGGRTHHGPQASAQGAAGARPESRGPAPHAGAAHGAAYGAALPAAAARGAPARAADGAAAAAARGAPARAADGVLAVDPRGGELRVAEHHGAAAWRLPAQAAADVGVAA